MNIKMKAKLEKQISEINQKESFKPFTKVKNSSKDKIRLHDLISPGRQNQKSEFNKNNKLIINTNPNNLNNNTNSINHFNYNPTSPNSTSYNKQLSNKKVYKILNSKKNSNGNIYMSDENKEYQNLHSKKTHKKFYKLIKQNLLDKYLRINYYTKIQTDALVENRYCRIVAKLRDLIISNSTDEFLRRYYRYQEIVERIPKIAKYYRNYLLFFCKPIFTNLFINKLIHVYGELKGEIYYNAHYGNKNKDKEKEKAKDGNNNNINNQNKNSVNFVKQNNNNNEMLFHTTIKNDINKNSMTISTIVKDVSYLNMNPLNLDFFGSNANYNYNQLSTYNNINEPRSGVAPPNKGNFNYSKNATLHSNKINMELNNLNSKINFAGAAVNSFTNNNVNRNNSGIITRRGVTSKKKSDNFVEYNNTKNNNYNSNQNNINGNSNVFKDKLSMNIKAELGNLYNNLLNANVTVNGKHGMNNQSNRNNSRRESHKQGKCPSANKKNARETDMDLPELNYDGFLTSENLIPNLAQKAIEKHFTSDSRDNSIVNILCTIGENKTNGDDYFQNKNSEKESTRRDNNLIVSGGISPKLNSHNHWKNSSLINNPGSSGNLNFNLISNNSNHAKPPQTYTSTKTNVISGNINTNPNISSKISESLTKNITNNFKNYLNFVGTKNRIKSSAVSSQLNPTKSDLKISQINSTNNILNSNFNLLNNMHYVNFSTKNIRNTTNNIFSTKHSNNNSDLIGSLDLKSEISNRFGSANNVNLITKNPSGKSNQKKPKLAETHRENKVITTNNQLQTQSNFSKFHSKNNLSSRIDKKLFDFDSNIIKNDHNNQSNKMNLNSNNKNLSGNVNKILANIQDNQERNASANSRRRLKFYSPDANAIKQLYNASNLNSNKENARGNLNTNSHLNSNNINDNKNNNNDNKNFYNITNSNFNTSNNFSGRKVLKRNFTVEDKNKKNVFSNANVNNINILSKISNLFTKKDSLAKNQGNQNNKKNFKLKDLLLNTNSNNNNNTNANLNHLNNFLTNTNIINTNGNFNTENNLVLNEINKNQMILNTFNGENLNENILTKFPSKSNILTSNLNNYNYNTSSNDDQLSGDMKITLNIKLNKNSNDLADIGRKLDISPLIPAFTACENKMIELNDAHLGIKNFNININNNINFNHPTNNNPNSVEKNIHMNAQSDNLCGNGNGNQVILGSKILSARKVFSKKKLNAKSSSVALNTGIKKEMKVLQNNLNSIIPNNTYAKKKDANNSKNIGFGDLVKHVNYKNLNLKNELLSPKKFYDKHIQQISSPKPLNISGSNIVSVGNQHIPHTTKNRKGDSLNRKSSNINI